MTNVPFGPLPVTDDVDTGGFWRAAAAGRLAVCVCADCGTVLHLPKAHCHVCGSWATTWLDVPPEGRVYSWTVTYQQLHAAFPTPYTVLLVELAEHPGVHLVGHLPGTPLLEVGMRVCASFPSAAPGVALVRWDPVTDESEGGAGAGVRL